MSEIKNSLDGFNHILEMTEQSVNFKTKQKKLSQTEGLWEKKGGAGGRVSRGRRESQGPMGNITKCKVPVTGYPEGQGRDNGVEKNYLKKYWLKISPSQ